MAGQESRHLRRHINQPVTVDLDDGTRREGVLVELRPSGPRVCVDGKDRTYAAWRITRARA